MDKNFSKILPEKHKSKLYQHKDNAEKIKKDVSETDFNNKMNGLKKKGKGLLNVNGKTIKFAGNFVI